MPRAPGARQPSDGGPGQGGSGRFARPRLYEQLADHITTFIEAQGLSEGDRLPPERSLAAELGVSRATLSRALVALEVRGTVEVQHGNGAVIVNRAAGQDDSPALAGRSAAELVEARAAVGAGLAAAAAGHPDAALRAALLAPDGRRESVAEVWSRIHRLAGATLLAELDRWLGARVPSPPDGPEAQALLGQMMRAVERGEPDRASLLATRLWSGREA